MANDVLSSKGLKVLNLNVRSLLPKFEEVKNKSVGFDIMSFTETWLTKYIPSGAINIKGYNLVRQDRDRNNKRGGGICLYIREDILYETSIDNINDKELETLGILVKAPNIKKICFLSVYRPPDGNYGRGMDRLVETVQHIDRNKCNLCILGDFNMDYAQSDTREKKKLMSIEEKLDLKQIITKNTRITQTTAKTIDLIFTDLKD